MDASVGDTEARPSAATFQEFLIHQRSLLNPAEFGFPLPTGRGRKPPKGTSGEHGLTQPQAARVCGMTPVRYARLEREEVEPTDDDLKALAEGLRLDDAKRDELYAKAGLPQDDPIGTLPHQLWLELIPNFGKGQPNAPLAFIVDVSWEILAFNDAFVEIFPGGKAPTNLFAWMLWDGVDQMIDHEGSWCGPTLAQLDQALTRHPGNKNLQTLMNRAMSDPRLSRFLKENRHMNYLRPDSDSRPVTHARTGQRGMLSVASAEPHGSPGSRVLFMTFTPEQDWPGPLVRKA